MLNFDGSEGTAGIWRLVEILTGIYYLFFGLNGFMGFMSIPPPSERGARFLKAINDTVYILPIVKFIEIGVGLSWIFGEGSVLSWILFTPIWIHILLYQIFWNRKDFFTTLFVASSHLLIAFKYRMVLTEILKLC